MHRVRRQRHALTQCVLHGLLQRVHRVHVGHDLHTGRHALRGTKVRIGQLVLLHTAPGVDGAAAHAALARRRIRNSYHRCLPFALGLGTELIHLLVLFLQPRYLLSYGFTTAGIAHILILELLDFLLPFLVSLLYGRPCVRAAIADTGPPAIYGWVP